MASKKISELTAVSALDGTEMLPVVQSSTTKSATVQQMREQVLTHLDFTAQDPVPAAPAASTARVYSRNGDTTRLVFLTPEGHEFDLTHHIIHQVRNSTGGELARGAVVRFSGSQGNITTIVPALATGEATEANGILLDTLADNGRGHVLEHGPLTGIDTSAWVEGTLLYLSASSAGTLTSTAPEYPNLAQVVARVTRQHASAGELSVVIRSPDDRTARGLRETSGPTVLTMGAVEDGQALGRVGTTIVGVEPSEAISAVGSVSSNYAISFTGAGLLTLTLTADVTISAVGMSATRCRTIRAVMTASGARTLAFDDSWRWLGTKPASLGDAESGLLTLQNTGNAASDVIASWQAIGTGA